MEKNKPDFREEAHQWSLRYCYPPQSDMEASPAAYDTFIHVYCTYVTPLQSQLSEAEKRIKELEHQVMLSDTAAEVAQQLYEESQSQNERLLSALKERESVNKELGKQVEALKGQIKDLGNQM